MGLCENKRPILCACRFHRRKLHDESESDNSSGLEVQYEIETFEESLVVTTWEKSKAPEAATATSPPPNLKREEKRPSLMVTTLLRIIKRKEMMMLRTYGMKILRHKSSMTRRVLLKILASRWRTLTLPPHQNQGNTSRSIQKEPKIQINALNEVPELKRLFKGYNMNWMDKTKGKYIMEMVHEFYANYYCTLEKKATSKNEIKKEPVLDSVRVRAIPVDISEWTITRVFMSGDYTVPTRTTEYDHQIEAMKGIKKLRTEDKLMHFQWMANIVVEDKEGAEWVTGRKLIHKASLNFLAKSWWSIVHHQLMPTVNDNILSTDKEALEACTMSEHLLNIPRIISTEIRELAVKDYTTFLFSILVYQLCMESGVPVFQDIEHMISNIRKVYIALIKDDLNSWPRSVFHSVDPD
ncbi:hypothetical protein HAX54_002068 [Datura stramonium]|uniref:Putative plant transposon protein domain-containing protein n=1 Tax=Datura stramonium TaxID=4076 RepID=A0ABS8WU15_DATST|nr:hypothetical protein [Datura stramonium]